MHFSFRSRRWALVGSCFSLLAIVALLYVIIAWYPAEQRVNRDIYCITYETGSDTECSTYLAHSSTNNLVLTIFVLLAFVTLFSWTIWVINAVTTIPYYRNVEIDQQFRGFLSLETLFILVFGFVEHIIWSVHSNTIIPDGPLGWFTAIAFFMTSTMLGLLGLFVVCALLASIVSCCYQDVWHPCGKSIQSNGCCSCNQDCCFSRCWQLATNSALDTRCCNCNNFIYTSEQVIDLSCKHTTHQSCQRTDYPCLVCATSNRQRV